MFLFKNFKKFSLEYSPSNTIYLNGIAQLIFDDNQIRINNKPNAFITYENTFLDGNTIEITEDPIWDLYDPCYKGKEFILEVAELIDLDDINNKPIISDFYATPILRNLRNKKLKTAIDLIYEKELAKFKKYWKQNHKYTKLLRKLKTSK